MLSREEISRYSRQMLLPEIGFAGQEKLKNTGVLVVGAGGLGCPVLLYLVASGIGKIGIIDGDVVDKSNLHRQILYDDGDVGNQKAKVAKSKLLKQNPLLSIEAYDCNLTHTNAIEIINEYDIVVDGTDNFATRYLVNDACFLLKKILVSGSIFKFEGQLTAFNFEDEEAPTYRCLFPEMPASDAALSCATNGVIGILPGVAGTLMANEVIKIATGIGTPLYRNLLLINLLTMNFQNIKYERNEEAVKRIPKSVADFKTANYSQI